MRHSSEEMQQKIFLAEELERSRCRIPPAALFRLEVIGLRSYSFFMRADFEYIPMLELPKRDAAAYWAINIYSEDGIRYPVRAMIEGLAFAKLPQNFKINEPILKEFYREELRALMDSGALVPAGSSRVSTVFFVEEDAQIEDNDIVVSRATQRLIDASSRLKK